MDGRDYYLGTEELRKLKLGAEVEIILLRDPRNTPSLESIQTIAEMEKTQYSI